MSKICLWCRYIKQFIDTQSYFQRRGSKCLNSSSLLLIRVLGSAASPPHPTQLWYDDDVISLHNTQGQFLQQGKAEVFDLQRAMKSTPHHHNHSNNEQALRSAWQVFSQEFYLCFGSPNLQEANWSQGGKWEYWGSPFPLWFLSLASWFLAATGFTWPN